MPRGVHYGFFPVCLTDWKHRCPFNGLGDYVESCVRGYLFKDLFITHQVRLELQPPPKSCLKPATRSSVRYNPSHKCCERMISCRHRCPSICGEKCPDREFYQRCVDVAALQRSVDLITFEKYGEIDVDKDPMVFLSCGHFYTTFKS